MKSYVIRQQPKLSKREQEELKKITKTKILQFYDEFCKDSDSGVLWTLHDIFGFGKERLLKFFFGYLKVKSALRKRYEADNSDDLYFIYRYKLKDELGIDMDDLYNEAEKLEKLREK